MNMGVEIERKFLVKADGSWRSGASGVPCRQGYIPTDGNCTVRLRIMGDQGFITLKARREGIERSEFEYPVR